MSVRTDADEKRDEAVQYLGFTIKAISEIVIERVWGWDSFNKEYQSKLREHLNTLMSIRDDLG